MKGIELASAYFREYGRAIIAENPRYSDYMAAGMAGEGSECLGFDDDISRDHDFGPGFCIWLPRRIFEEAGVLIQDSYDRMPKEFMGCRRLESAQGKGRVGVMTIEDFYMKFTGLDRAPADNMEWFRIPDRFLAMVTSGRVFMDNYGRFSEIRAVYENYFPEDVLKKKLAARCTLMAQSGQYNYRRSVRRGDWQAAYMACGEFVRHAMSVLYLLNGKYMPYYKWVFRGAGDFATLKGAVEGLKELSALPDGEETGMTKADMIEDICVAVAGELNRRGYTKGGDAFLQTQGQELMESITDPRLRGMHIMVDV